MTFNAFETSREAGRPVELYEFTYGSIVYRYTTAAETMTYEGEDYAPVAMRRPSISMRTSFDNTTMRLTADYRLTVAGLYRVQPPSSVVAVTIRAHHEGDPDGEYNVAWMGRLLSVMWSGSEVNLECEPITVSMKRPGLSRQYQKPCPYTLYRCGVDKDDFKVTGALAAVSGVTVSLAGAAAKPDNWFAGGYLEYINSVTGAVEYRPIESSSGANLVLMFGAVNIAATGTAYAGCDHTTTMCRAKFANYPNYGGQPYIPVRNPFGGTDLF